jgi:hypothetical protein
LLGLVASKPESNLVDGRQVFSSATITINSTTLLHVVEVKATYGRHPESPQDHGVTRLVVGRLLERVRRVPVAHRMIHPRAAL